VKTKHVCKPYMLSVATVRKEFAQGVIRAAGMTPPGPVEPALSLGPK
jgi:hypothetical protein